MGYRWRVGAVIALIAVMAGALFVLLTRDSDTVAAETTLATDTTVAPTTTTSANTTTTTSTTLSPEARITEVEVILEDLWFRWFDAIYRQDEAALADIVALQRDYQAGVSAMDSMQFISAPSLSGVIVEVTQIALDRPDCIAAEYSLDASLIRGIEEPSTGLQVLWPRDSGWRLARSWSGAGDLWQVDCDVTDRTEIP